MSKYLRVFIMIVVLLGILGLAQSRVAWAQPSAEPGQSVQSQDVSSAPQPELDAEKKGGTVKPPPGKTKICKNGIYSLGGVATLTVKNLAKDYCILASLQKSKLASGHVPKNAGKILADVTVIQVMYKNRRVSKLPAYAGTVELCYAVPPGRTASLYILHDGSGTWEPLGTTVSTGTACGSARVSASYALIGK